MKIHELKTIQPFYDMVVTERKHFEYRKNDRFFLPGDLLLLKEYDKDKGYSGREQLVLVQEMVDGYESIGLPKGYCIMEIQKVEIIVSTPDKREG